MHYVYLENNIVIDQAQIDPYKVFNAEYASKFIEAPDEVTHFWRLEDGQWVPPPGPSVEEIKSQNKTQASILLLNSDWSQNPDVIDTSVTPHLKNVEEWKNYRLTLRAIAINPPETQIQTWPTKPDAIWSN